MRAQDPVFAQIPEMTVEHVPATEVSIDGEPGSPAAPSLRTEPFSLEMTGSLPIPELISGDADSLYVAATEAAHQALEQFMPRLFDLASRACDAVGNTVDAQGRDPNDAILDALEKVEWNFDEEGRPTLVIVTSPETAVKLAEAEARATPAQRERYDQIVRRKREEQDASKRSRRIPRYDD